MKLRSALRRITYPPHLWKIINLERRKKQLERAYDDSQLKLYSKILPGDFLHYGYFDDPTTNAQDISLNDFHQAQLRYAELILEQIEDHDSPVLDIGCGMGGLARLMLDRGFSPVALSPDRNQIDYIKSKYPRVPLIESKFEDVSWEENLSAFGTAITSESLQYLNLDLSLPLLAKLLRPGGRWIACDYFRIGKAKEKSGHHWDDFEKRILQSGWELLHQRDITPHVLPMLRYIYLWGNIARPALDFALEKLHIKQPGVHYILEEIIKTLNEKFDKNLELVNPELFAANKRYMLLVLTKH